MRNMYRVEECVLLSVRHKNKEKKTRKKRGWEKFSFNFGDTHYHFISPFFEVKSIMTIMPSVRKSFFGRNLEYVHTHKMVIFIDTSGL